MISFQTGDIVANGIRIHYYRTGGTPAGGNKPPLVLAHGATDDGLCWTPVAEVLAADYDVILPDARGHGLSEATDAGNDSATRAADLAAFIQALGLRKPAIGGHSMGAESAFLVAAEHPYLSACVVLEDPPFWLDAAAAAAREDPKGARVSFADQTAKSKAATREQLIAFCRQQSPTWPEADLGPWADAKQRVSLSAFAAPWKPAELGWREGFHLIKSPVLLVTADPKLGAIITSELASAIVAESPLVQSVFFAGAGHNIRREAFDEFIEAVRDFLSRSYSPN